MTAPAPPPEAMLAALYIDPRGPYPTLEGVDCTVRGPVVA